MYSSKFRQIYAKQFGDLCGKGLSSELQVAAHIQNVSKNLHLLSVILIGWLHILKADRAQMKSYMDTK